MAYAKVHKFREALGEQPERDMPATDADSLDPTKDQDKPKIVANKRNETAIACLTMAFFSESQLGLIYAAQTDDYPGGLACLVIRQLMRKYKPKDTISRVSYARS